MGSQDERPAKRVKTRSSPLPLSTQNQESTPNSKLNLKSKYKNKSVGKPLGIKNDFKSADNDSNRKAISYSTLIKEKEEKKKKDISKTLNGVIDLDSSEADISFKVLSSSQEFNIDQIVSKTGIKSSPDVVKVRPSLDDGIFWIETSCAKESLDKYQNFDPKVSSSPLRNIYKEARDDYDAFDLIDPDVKSLVIALKPQHEDTKRKRNHKPDLSRSKSDPKGLESKNTERRNFKQVINGKGNANESLLGQKKNIDILNQNKSFDIANMLTRIGETLSFKQTNSMAQFSDYKSKEDEVIKDVFQGISGNINKDPDLPKDIPNGQNFPMNKTIVNIGNNYELDKDNENVSDVFSDDIDLDDPEVDKIIATQAPALLTQVKYIDEKQQKSDVASDDTFSDDDELFEKAVDKMTQDMRSVSTRPNTDQTDIAGFEIDTRQTVSKMKNLDLNRIGETMCSKYKSLANVTTETSCDSSKLDKGFHLYEAKDNLAKSALKYDLMKRLQIKEVNQSYKKDKKEYVLKCITAEDEIVTVFVRDQWAELDYQMNDVIHIITAKKGDNFRIVSSKINLLIWNPDVLVSATNVAGSLECQRRSVINQKFSGPGEASIPMIVGSITHELFQKCLLNKCTDESYADEIISEQVNMYLMDIFSVGKSADEVKNLVKGHFLYVKDWIEDYVGIENSSSTRQIAYRASNILDIEENIMSPVYGVRGIIDVVIEAEIQKNKFVIPMEIKSGTPNIANHAQALLYTLLVTQQYGVDSKYFSLVFTKTKDCVLEVVKRGHLVALVNLRNTLSQYLVYGATNLPPLLRTQSTCERCFVREPCMVLNKLVEDGTPEKSGISPGIYDNFTNHLTDKRYTDFYKHWDNLITKEEGLGNYVKRNLWCKSSKDRESNGGECLGSLKLVGSQYINSKNQYLYIFERDATANLPLNSSNIAKYDRIILSEENSTFGLAQGFIKLITSDTVVIITSKNWSDSGIRLENFDVTSNQTFKSTLHPESGAGFAGSISDDLKSKAFRIDKDAISFGMSMARYNLLNLFMPGGDSNSRELLVEYKTPSFSDTSNFTYKHAIDGLNKDQLKAVDIASKIEDYCLILGMPGTGKTTLISNMIDCMVKSGYSVLISSHTHSAVDNICEKLIRNAEKKHEHLPLLRVGDSSKISSAVESYSLHSKQFGKNIDDNDTFKVLVENTQIVASTCLGISDIIFSTGKRYDYCIIDEASQVSLPIVLGPISFCDRFILVGDHYQLPPLVKHPEAKSGGLDQSLFKILSEVHPQSVVELTHQYRMCEDIMSLSNELIYNGRLKCGSEVAAKQKLLIQNFELLPIAGTCVETILDPERRVVFVNGDAVSGIHEVIKGDKVDNPGEANFISALIKILLLGGIKGEDIGVMSFYNAQLKHFHMSLKNFSTIEILTADRFQGRDKNVIIISLVRTDALGDLLKEWRRFNVAITRARCKLIIFGSKKLLESEEQFEGFMEMIKEKKWDYDLAVGDDIVASNFDFSSIPDSQKKTVDDPEKLSTQSIFKGITNDSKAVQRTKLLKYILGEMIE